MAVSKLPAAGAERNRLIADPAVKGLFRRWQDGKASWVVRYTVAGKARQKTLVATRAADARLEGAAILQQARVGVDVVAENLARTVALRAKMKAAREVERIQQHRTIGILARDYLAKGCGNLKPATRRQREAYLREVLAVLHGEDAETVARARLMAVLDAVAEQRGGPTRNRALGALSACLNWAGRQGLVERIATAGIRALPEKSRDRVLSLEELRQVWAAAGELGAFGAIVRLLILTGQRRDEVAELEWGEVDLAAAMISLPRARTKNGKPHDVPLSRQAALLLEALEHRPGKRVFAAQTWARLKTRLDKAVPLEKPWVLHDLRRSAVTHMAGKLRIAPHVVEAVVNHISGHKSGVAGVYNRATYEDEKSEALQRWADHLLEVEPAKVVPLRR